MKKSFFLLIAVLTMAGCKSNEPEKKTTAAESFQKAIDLLEKDSALTVQTIHSLGFTYMTDDTNKEGPALVFTKEKWNGTGIPGEFYRVRYQTGQSIEVMYHLYLGQGNLAAANAGTYMSMAATDLPLPGTGNEVFKEGKVDNTPYTTFSAFTQAYANTSTYASGEWEKGLYEKTMLVQYYDYTGYTFVRFTAEVEE